MAQWCGDLAMRPVMRMAIFVPAVLALCAGCQRPVNTKESPAAKPETKQVSDQSDLPLAGTLSCSGRGCHASLDQSRADEKPLPCAFSLWSDNDPHTRAWYVLWQTKRGRGMSELLHPEAKDKDGEPNAVAKDPRCLACHVTPQAADLKQNEHGARDEWQFGVGCEGCHGRASGKDGWLHRHYRDKWTTNKTPAAEKKKYGLNDLSDLRERALVCAGCHVGAPADDTKMLPLRDMNHDHVAAGHPRLMFEFAAFLANEPKHWLEAWEREKDEGKREEQKRLFQGRAWALGQL